MHRNPPEFLFILFIEVNYMLCECVLSYIAMAVKISKELISVWHCNFEVIVSDKAAVT